jgi:ABC-type multidrug transport system permease subunit
MVSYIIVIAAGILIIFTIFFAFKTFKILLKAIFNN